jgi:hypothetical protein
MDIKTQIQPTDERKEDTPTRTQRLEPRGQPKAWLGLHFVALSSTSSTI